MLRIKSLYILFFLTFALSVYAQNEIDKSTVRRIGELSAGIREKCDSITFYQKAIEKDKNEISAALSQIEAYSKKPFSEMSLSKVSALPDDYIEIKEAFFKYNQGRELLAGELDGRRIKEMVKTLRFKSLNERQNQDIKQLRDLLDTYEHCGDDILSLIILKNQVLENFLDNQQSLTIKTWSSLKDPWRNIDPGDYKKLNDKFKELKVKYAQIPYVNNWLDEYSKLLFEDRVPPFTPWPERFQETYRKNRDYIDTDESLISKESSFIK